MKKYLTLVFAVLLVFVAACGSDDSSAGTDEGNQENQNEEMEEEKAETEETGDQSETEETDNTEESSDEEYYFDGTNLVTENFSIEITDYKVLEPGEGDNDGDEPIIGFWYDMTVDEDATEEEIDPMEWIMVFEAIQDNDPDVVNTLEVGTLPDEEHLDSQMQTIKPGGTSSSSVSYELTDTETPVTLIAKGNPFSDDELGKHDYSIE